LIDRIRGRCRSPYDAARDQPGPQTPAAIIAAIIRITAIVAAIRGIAPAIIGIAGSIIAGRTHAVSPIATIADSNLSEAIVSRPETGANASDTSRHTARPRRNSAASETTGADADAGSAHTTPRDHHPLAASEASAPKAAASKSTAAAEPATANAGTTSPAATPLGLGIVGYQKSTHCKSAQSQEEPVHRHPPFADG
jgi:hypothetical protein